MHSRNKLWWIIDLLMVLVGNVNVSLVVCHCGWEEAHFLQSSSLVAEKNVTKLVALVEQSSQELCDLHRKTANLDLITVLEVGHNNQVHMSIQDGYMLHWCMFVWKKTSNNCCLESGSKERKCQRGYFGSPPPPSGSFCQNGHKPSTFSHFIRFIQLCSHFIYI